MTATSSAVRSAGKSIASKSQSGTSEKRNEPRHDLGRFQLPSPSTLPRMERYWSTSFLQEHCKRTAAVVELSTRLETTAHLCGAVNVDAICEEFGRLLDNLLGCFESIVNTSGALSRPVSNGVDFTEGGWYLQLQHVVDRANDMRNATENLKAAGFPIQEDWDHSLLAGLILEVQKSIDGIAAAKTWSDDIGNCIPMAG